MEYNFWGWQNATVPAITDEYRGIHTPIDLYDALTHIWCADTCAPRLRDGWTEDNKTLGQCSITAFLAQDIFGGEVYGIFRRKHYHLGCLMMHLRLIQTPRFLLFTFTSMRMAKLLFMIQKRKSFLIQQHTVMQEQQPFIGLTVHKFIGALLLIPKDL